jgi:hypothetical protein
MVATGIRLTAQLVLQAAFHCLGCGSSDGIHSYDLKADRWVKEVATEPAWEVQWQCEHDCQWSCHATRIEVSLRFLRIAFACVTCQGRATRFYDVEKQGYADVTGRIVSHAANRFASHNYGRYVGGRWERP